MLDLLNMQCAISSSLGVILNHFHKSPYPFYTYFKIFILRVWVFCLHVCLCTMCVHVHRGQKRAVSLLELELQMVLSRMWVLGIESRSSERATNALSLWLSLQSQISLLCLVTPLCRV